MEILILPGDRARLFVDAFYEMSGRQTRARDGDIFFVAVENSRVIGSVRFCVEEGYPLLRGMFVDEAERGRGLGKKILAAFDDYLTKNQIITTYCLPYEHLEKFYGAIGFEKMDPKSGPPFLYARMLEYQKRDRYIMMQRNR